MTLEDGRAGAAGDRPGLVRWMDGELVSRTAGESTARREGLQPEWSRAARGRQGPVVLDAGREARRLGKIGGLEAEVRGSSVCG